MKIPKDEPVVVYTDVQTLIINAVMLREEFETVAETIDYLNRTQPQILDQKLFKGPKLE